jgi:hypothetical protein
MNFDYFFTLDNLALFIRKAVNDFLAGNVDDFTRARPGVAPVHAKRDPTRLVA